jgi:hypothetical protein
MGSQNLAELVAHLKSVTVSPLATAVVEAMTRTRPTPFATSFH